MHTDFHRQPQQRLHKPEEVVVDALALSLTAVVVKSENV